MWTRWCKLVKELTGLSWSDVLPELRAGQTLTEILEANGADSQAVRDAVGAAVTAEIEEAVAAGTLTQERADELLAVLPDWLADHFESPSWFAGSEAWTGMMLHRFSGFRDGMSGRFGGFREGAGPLRRDGRPALRYLLDAARESQYNCRGAHSRAVRPLTVSALR